MNYFHIYVNLPIWVWLLIVAALVWLVASGHLAIGVQ